MWTGPFSMPYKDLKDADTYKNLQMTEILNQRTNKDIHGIHFHSQHMILRKCLI